MLTSYAVASRSIIGSGIFTYGREVMFHIINVYAVRMAGVFMIVPSTIWLRTGLMHRGWAFVTYGLAFVLADRQRINESAVTLALKLEAAA